MTESQADPNENVAFDPEDITRPDPALWTYYVIVCILILPAFPFIIWPHYFKYHTLRYRFDDKGISMSWGLLFRKEIYLTYRRIQDIHVTRNIIQRWLGLASVAVQTASGTSGAEMTIEGLTCAEEMRDFLYRKMRGAEDHAAAPEETVPSDQAGPIDLAPATGTQLAAGVGNDGEAMGLLLEIRDELRGLRHDLQAEPQIDSCEGEAPS